MAQRRMFSKTITNSSEFLMMSQSAQNLYFHFGMNADDDGFCEVFTTMRMTDSKPGDLKALHEGGFVLVADSKVCIIKDWHENNQLRADRYKKSQYLSDPKYLELYSTIMGEKVKEIELYKGVLNGNQVATNGNHRLGKVSIGKVRKEKTKTSAPQADAVPFILEEKLESMESKPGKHLDIIATFIRVGKLQPRSSAELTAVIKRYAKIAATLTAFVEPDGTMPRIFNACKVCQEESQKLGYQWSLDTVYKKLTQ